MNISTIGRRDIHVSVIGKGKCNDQRIRFGKDMTISKILSVVQYISFLAL